MKKVLCISSLLIVAAAAPGCGEKNAAPAPTPSAFHPANGGVWTCPMCPMVLAGRSGKCPSCAMDLINTPTALVWTCLKHPIALREEPGNCPACNRPLCQVTMAIAWRCPEHPEEKRHEAGVCRRCRSDLEEVYEPLPHGDHNPRHGGQFFMAADQWHHLEGTYPEKGILRIYLYDDFTRPISARRASGRAELSQGDVAPPRTVKLQPEEDGMFLEARFKDLVPFPVRVTAVLKFEKTGETSRFDFQFDRYTVVDEAPPAAIQPEPARNRAASQVERLAPAELVQKILARDREVQKAIEERRWEQIYIPALEAKDLALQLEARLEELKAGTGSPIIPADATLQQELAKALRPLVRGAWLLDYYGDQGDGSKVKSAYQVFALGTEGLHRLADSLKDGSP